VPRIACRVEVEGVVQGVGFRPFVHRLATRLGLAGEVLNHTGGVTAIVEGREDGVAEFLERLRTEHPPAAVIDRAVHYPEPLAGRTEFVILASAPTGEGAINLPPDLATCAECLVEMRDPSDRRHLHPFINCTNCGPRFTIVRAVPYDRPRTSMSAFQMCPTCRHEYGDIADRRYHAQPVACHDCGPSLTLVVDGHELARGHEAITRVRALLADRRIVAVKGIGGFHLACDASSELAVTELRRRKRREEKPFAVMFRDLQAVARHCVLSDEAARHLVSARAPIVLLDKAPAHGLAPSVAPDSATFGAILPYAPLQHLLFDGAPYEALVMTSGNLSEEPICTGNTEAMERLSGVADAFLVHDRDIVTGCDDSVLRSTGRGVILLRRSRGYMPAPTRLRKVERSILAVGGHTRNTFCVTRGWDAYVSQHIGDLDDADVLAFYERQVEHFLRFLEVRPSALARDLHPGYLSSAWAEQRAAEDGLRVVTVQHHHAHIASVLSEHAEPGPVLGVACDGTGLAADGTVWGCELLVADERSFERVGHLLEVPLPGGEAAVREPWRMALAWAELALGGEDPLPRLPHLAPHASRWEVLRCAMRAGLNCPRASSAGRLFDAVSAMLGICEVNAYEGQAPMRLEAAARDGGPELEWDVAPIPIGTGVPAGDALTPAPFAGAQDRLSRRERESGSAVCPDTAHEQPHPRSLAVPVTTPSPLAERGNGPEPVEGPGGEVGLGGGWPAGNEKTPERDMLILDPRPAIRRILELVSRGVSVGELAGAFHGGFCTALAQAAAALCERQGLRTVALSGGTFQNARVLCGTADRLEESGLRVLYPRAVPPGDGGLALGQAVVAAAVLREEG